jgi:hypothetical protein
MKKRFQIKGLDRFGGLSTDFAAWHGPENPESVAESRQDLESPCRSLIKSTT